MSSIVLIKGGYVSDASFRTVQSFGEVEKLQWKPILALVDALDIKLVLSGCKRDYDYAKLACVIHYGVRS